MVLTDRGVRNQITPDLYNDVAHEIPTQWKQGPLCIRQWRLNARRERGENFSSGGWAVARGQVCWLTSC